MNKKPATTKARLLLAKLQALAERGINGERDAAKVKLDRLLARYDFTLTDGKGTKDLFAGAFIKSSVAEPVAPLDSGALDVASFVKWAIEARCDIPCLFKGGSLWAQADRKTAKKLATIAGAVSGSFLSLWGQFRATPGVNPADRGVFLRGLYDGMLGDESRGEALPARIAPEKIKRAKKKDVAHPAGLTAHPYSIAVALGRQITMCVPLPEISNQLDNTVQALIGR